MADPNRLDDRIVIITGASRGIGAEVARTASQRGASVVLVSRSVDALDRLVADLSGPSRVVAGDVTDTETAIAALDAVDELPGTIWGLVNNAGVNPFYHGVTDTPLAEWDQVLQTNLLGAATFARVAGRAMIESGTGGRIVNVSSIAGLTGLPNIGPYNASKAGLDAMTRTLAVELGGHGVLINSVAPGTIATEMIEQLMESNPALAEKLIAKCPMGRFGTVTEAAEPIIFLLSDASSFINGHVLVIDGGRLAAG